MRKNKSKKSVLYSWSISYSVVFLVPAIAFSVLMAFFNRLTTEQIENYNDINMNYIVSSMDDKLNEYYRILNYVTNSECLSRVMAINDISTAGDYYKLMELKDEMRNYIDGFEINDLFYIYLSNSNMVVSGREVAQSSEFYRLYYKGKNVSYSEWLDKIKYNPFPFSNIGTDGDTVISVSPIPITERYNKNASLVMEMDLKELKDELFEKNKINPVFAVFDNNNNVLITSDGIMDVDLELLKNAKSSGVKKNNGKIFYVKVEKNLLRGYKYVCMLSKPQVFGKINILRNMTAIVIVIIAVFGVVLIRKNIRENYTPIERIVKSIGTHTENDENEYRLIEKTMDKIMQQNEALNDIAKKQKQLLRDNFLCRLMKYSVNEVSNELLSEHEIKFAGNNFIIMLFFMEDFEELFSEEDISEEEKYNVVEFIMKNVAEEAAQTCETIGYFTEIDSAFSLLLSFSDNGARNAQSSAYDLAKFISEFFVKNFKIYFKTSVSALQRDISGISMAYNMALEAMEYRFILDADIISYEEIFNEKKGVSGYKYDFEVEQALISNIKSGNKEKAQQGIDEIFKDLSTPGTQNIENIRVLAYDVIGTFMKLQNGNKDIMSSFVKWENLNDLISRLKKVTVSLCEDYSNRKKMRLKNLVDDYIESNYSNPNLGVALIAEELGFHRSYLSTMYKEQTGIGILEAINRYRLERAKELLKDTEQTVESISTEVGYADSRSLIRVFKKYKGITPSAFRADINEENR